MEAAIHVLEAVFFAAKFQVTGYASYNTDYQIWQVMVNLGIHC